MPTGMWPQRSAPTRRISSATTIRGTQLAREALTIAERVDELMYLISAAHTATRHGAAADGLPHRPARSRSRAVERS